MASVEVIRVAMNLGGSGEPGTYKTYREFFDDAGHSDTTIRDVLLMAFSFGRFNPIIADIINNNGFIHAFMGFLRRKRSPSYELWEIIRDVKGSQSSSVSLFGEICRWSMYTYTANCVLNLVELLEYIPITILDRSLMIQDDDGMTPVHHFVKYAPEWLPATNVVVLIDLIRDLSGFKHALLIQSPNNLETPLHIVKRIRNYSKDIRTQIIEYILSTDEGKSIEITNETCVIISLL